MYQVILVIGSNFMPIFKYKNKMTDGHAENYLKSTIEQNNIDSTEEYFIY
jgi:hypothetical protein